MRFIYYWRLSYLLHLAALLPWGITGIPWSKRNHYWEQNKNLPTIWKYDLINAKMFRFPQPRTFHLSRIIGFSQIILNINKLTHPIFFKKSEIERSVCTICYFPVIYLQTKQWSPFTCGKSQFISFTIALQKIPINRSVRSKNIFKTYLVPTVTWKGVCKRTVPPAVSMLPL